MVELRNVFDLQGKHVGARRAMAELQMERGNLRGAYRQYLYLAEAFPEDLESRIILAEMAFSDGNWEELERHGAQAIELSPDTDDPRIKIISLLRQYRAAIEEDSPTERRDLARQADLMLAEKPESLLLRNVIMDNSIREQDFTRALSEIDWMIANEPKKSLYYQERLRVLAMLGDNRGIEAQLREMIEVFPNEAAHKETLVRFYVSRSNLDAAEDVLRQMASASADDDPDPTIDLIRFLVAYRDSETVRAEIARAIAERADPVPFQTIEASFEFSVGNRTEAIATLQEVLTETESSEQSQDTRITLAKMLLVTGNEVGARTNVEQVLAENANHPEALKMQAHWQVEADDTDAAIGALRIALDQQPQDAEAMTLIANAYARAGQSELARDYLAQAVQASGNAPAETLRYAQILMNEESYLPAEDILLSALRLAPSNTEILITLGQLYLRLEDFDRARSVVDALRRTGDNTAIQAANELEAERLNRQQGTDTAMSFLEELANSAEANLGTKIALLRARLSTGDKAGALALAKVLKEEDPANRELEVVLAEVQTSNGNLDAAETIYRSLLAENPVLPRIWLSLSRLELMKGDREAAKSIIDESLGQNPDNPDLLWAKASYEERDGNIDTAIEIYEKLYEKDSNPVVVANNLASLLATYRDDDASLDRAWVIARRFREAEAPALQDTYGWILHRRGQSAEALSYLESAAQGLPGDPIVQYHLGQVLVALNRPEDALEQFRKAVDIAGPTDVRPQIEEARSLVQSLQDTDKIEN
ncbi:tetratricopeptide repeat protein [Marimonas sp. MJW-29]|uniref:Tetratricopeptide repeat protein n=1 Tax=Sulfitobacter sediminis TaxID=3234186 RepID=A0ABV3RQH0_9RHOB